MKSILRILKILTPKQMRACVGLIILMFFGAIIEAIGIGALYPLIAIIGNPNFLNEHQKIQSIVGRFGVQNHSQLIIFCSICLIIFYIIKNLYFILQNKLQIYFSMNNQKDYTRRLYKYYLSKSYLYHVNTNSSILIRNISSGGEITFSNILVSLLCIITEFITVLIIWIMLLIMDWSMALLVAGVLGPVVVLILKFFRRKINKQGELQKRCISDYNKWLYQGLGSIKETKVMQKEDYFSDQFSKSYSEYSDATRDFLVIDKIPRILVELTGVGGILLLVIVKIATGSNPQSIVPSLGVLALAAVRLMPSINRIISLYNTIKLKMPLFNEIYEDLLAIKTGKDLEERKIKIYDKVPLEFNKEISIKNLSFKYPNTTKEVLKDITFKIPKGSFVGIVGASGAGKTTFVDILLGLLPPENGEICVDDKNIYLNISSWLSHIAYVPQSIYLVDGTIKENIALGIPKKEVSNERIAKVLSMSELYDFVQSLPDKENTNVGEMGGKLSGGQKQRIGIARALYNNPSILVLDEATSALDNETEKNFTNTILKLKGQITIISIAHRLSTLEDCDFKIRFENGKAKQEKNY